jgi:hypothetical protein
MSAMKRLAYISLYTAVTLCPMVTFASVDNHQRATVGNINPQGYQQEQHSGAAIALQKSPNHDLPRVFLLNAKSLFHTKLMIASGRHRSDAAIAKLEEKANAVFNAGPFSVTDKSVAPVSGDKHDYVSLGRDWWPNPKTTNGFPYIRRDGQVNPEIDKISDQAKLGKMISTVHTLSMAYYFTGKEAYAVRATQLLRTWFLDKSTRMNPNLKYAQAMRDPREGQGAGILDTRGLTQTIDDIGLLAGSQAWTVNNQQGMQQWFSQYLNWLETSSNGKAEAKALNNHGSWYAVQVAAIALFLDNKNVAIQVLQGIPSRIAQQIEPDGRQPLELASTKPWNYSVFNLQALFRLATLGEQVGIDLWNFRTPDGRSLRVALDYLAPFALDKSKWHYKQMTKWNDSTMAALLHQAAIKYKSQLYQQVSVKITWTDAVSDEVNEFYGFLFALICSLALIGVGFRLSLVRYIGNRVWDKIRS